LSTDGIPGGVLDDLPDAVAGGRAEDWADPEVLPLPEVRELFLVLGKALRAYQLYDRNNPVYHRFLQNLVDAFRAVWVTEEALHLVVEESRITWKGEEVYRSEQRSDSLAFLLYRDGVREFTPLPGIEEGELEGLLDVLHRAKHARGEADDLVTLLWDREFAFLRYVVVDLLAEGVEVPEKGEHTLLPDPTTILGAEGFTLVDAEEGPGTEEGEDTGDQVGAEAEARPEGTIRPEDFNPTLYALDPSDRAYVAELRQAEEERNLRADVLTALFDRFEESGRPDRQREVAGILGQLLPNLLSRGYMREVGMMLQQLEEIRTRNVVDPAADTQVEEALAELASPDSVTELVRALEDGVLTVNSRELAAYLRHLRSTALAPLLSSVETTQHPQIRRTLKDAIREIARANPQGVFALLQSRDELVVSGAVRLVGTLGLPQAARALGTLLQTAPLPVRRAVVETAIELPSAALAPALEKALFSEDRPVRIGAARALGLTGNRASAGALEDILSGPEFREADVGEKVAFFDAYGRLAGGQGVEFLSRMLNGKGLFGYREPAENRAGAARALGVIGTPGALQALERSADDPDPVVRTAVNRALRGGGEEE
jgi:HEAT repeat protein